MDNYNITKYIEIGTYYYLDHLLHRTDGPAIEQIDGKCFFYIFGTKMSFSLWLINIESSKEEKMLYKLKWGGQLP